MKNTDIHVLFLSTVFSFVAQLTYAEEDANHNLLMAKCGSCHLNNQGGYERIDAQRKTPEGWYMTIFRMVKQQGVNLSDREIEQLTDYLADTRGLTPQETLPYRYALERDHSYIEPYNAVDKPDPDGLAVMCTTCHSYARFALQRRNEDEWRKLVHFHVGQFPAIEMTPSARANANYWRDISEITPATLARRFPLDQAQWQAWKNHKAIDMSGRWRVVGHLPGSGPYEGIYQIERAQGNRYNTQLIVNYSDARNDQVSGSGKLLSGHEWRGKSELRSNAVREIYQVSADGNQLQGRWYNRDHFELRATFFAKRIQSGTSTVMAVFPSHLKPGRTTRVKIIGYNLKGAVSLGEDANVEVISRDDETIHADVYLDKNATLGQRQVNVGKSDLANGVVVYKKLDYVAVEPGYALARLGYGGGKVPSVMAQFDAIGYLNGNDNRPGTDDDIRVGMFSGDWSLTPYDELAREWQDHKFAGIINDRGLFSPAPSGANPNRIPNTTVNNSGNLYVVVEVTDGEYSLRGKGRLVVTHFPLYFNAPIR